MNISGLVRLTADAEMATTQSGKQVLKIKAVCNNGFGENQRAVWIDASWFGDRGTKLVQYLTKGTQIVIHADQVEANGYQSKDGIKASLRMNVVNIELVARNSGEQSAPKQAPQAPQAQQSPNAALPNANDFHNDEIPW